MPLLKCLRTQCEPFSGPKCTVLHDFTYTISNFCGEGVIPPDPCERSPLIEARHQFSLGLPAFHCSCFIKRPPVTVILDTIADRFYLLNFTFYILVAITYVHCAVTLTIVMFRLWQNFRNLIPSRLKCEYIDLLFFFVLACPARHLCYSDIN